MKTTRLLSTALASVILFSPAAGAVKPDSCSDAEEPTIKRARICEDTLDESTSDESTSDESTSDESTSDIETPEDIPIPEIKSDYEHDNFVKAIKKQNREDNRNHTYARRPSGWKPAIEELPTGERVDNWLMSTCGEDYNYAFTFDFKPFLPFDSNLDMLRMRAWFMYYYKRGKYDLPQWVIDLKKEQDKETSSTTSTTACEETGEPESVNQEDDDGTPKDTCEMSAESEQSHSHTASLGHVLEMSSDQETYSLTAPKHTSEATFEVCAELVEKKKHTEDLGSGSSPFYEPKIPAIGNAYAHGSFMKTIFRKNTDDDYRREYRRRPKDWKPAIEELPTGEIVDRWLRSTCENEYHLAVNSTSFYGADADPHNPELYMPRMRAWFMYYYKRGKYELPQWVIDLKKEQDKEQAAKKERMQALDLLTYLATTQDDITSKK